MTGQARAEKVVSMKKSIKSQREIITKHKHQNEAAVRASFKICHVLATAGKPVTDSEFVKTCLEKAVQELYPQNQQLFNSIFKLVWKHCCSPNDRISALTLVKVPRCLSEILMVLDCFGQVYRCVRFGTGSSFN